MEARLSYTFLDECTDYSLMPGLHTPIYGGDSLWSVTRIATFLGVPCCLITRHSRLRHLFTRGRLSWSGRWADLPESQVRTLAPLPLLIGPAPVGLVR